MESLYQQPVSYRQVGCKKKPSKKVAKKLSVKTTPSIPGKYETILNVGGGEKNAFGDRSYRFHESNTIAPGPGAYGTLASFENKNPVSISKKGFGAGFVSKALRFHDDEYTTPGPGEYSVHVAKKVASNNKSKIVSTFVPSDRCSTAPGPGQYNINAPKCRYKQAPSSIFKSNNPRSTISNTMTPSPGQYDNPYEISKKIVKPAIVSKVPRCQDNLPKDNLPGPGSYPLPQKNTSTRPSSVFQSTSRSPPKSTPKPTLKPALKSACNSNNSHVPHLSMDSMYKSSNRLQMSKSTNNLKNSSVFQSSTIRTSNTIPLNPGPASYHTSIHPKHRSHLQNPRSKWV